VSPPCGDYWGPVFVTGASDDDRQLGLARWAYQFMAAIQESESVSYALSEAPGSKHILELLLSTITDLLGSAQSHS
jgi:hypothetical protein